MFKYLLPIVLTASTCQARIGQSQGTTERELKRKFKQEAVSFNNNQECVRVYTAKKFTYTFTYRGALDVPMNKLKTLTSVFDLRIVDGKSRCGFSKFKSTREEIVFADAEEVMMKTAKLYVRKMLPKYYKVCDTGNEYEYSVKVGSILIDVVLTTTSTKDKTIKKIVVECNKEYVEKKEQKLYNKYLSELRGSLSHRGY